MLDGATEAPSSDTGCRTEWIPSAMSGLPMPS